MLLVFSTALGTACANPIQQSSPETLSSDVVKLPPARQLAGQAALGQGKTFTAEYRYQTLKGGQDSKLTTKRNDAALSIEFERPAAEGKLTHTVSIIRESSNTYRCVSTSVARGCQPVSQPTENIADIPQVWRVFDEWLAIFTNPTAALSVTIVDKKDTLSQVRGVCFSVEKVTASLAAPVEPGIYCFDNGLITGIKVGGETMTLVSAGPAPVDIALPAPAGSEFPSIVAPAPTGSASVSPSPAAQPT